MIRNQLIPTSRPNVASDSLELAKLLLSNLVHEVYNVFGGGAVNVAGTFESFGRLLPVSFLEVPSRESVVLQQRQEGHAKIDAFFNTNFSYKYDPDYQPFIRTVMLEMPLPGPALFGRARFIPLKGARVRTVAAGAMDRAAILQKTRPVPKNVSVPARGNVLEVGNFKYANTAGKHIDEVVKRGAFKGELSRPYMKSQLMIDEIMAAGKPILDPGGIPGGLRWDVPGTFRSSEGTWELVIHPETKTIYHFNFK